MSDDPQGVLEGPGLLQSLFQFWRLALAIAVIGGLLGAAYAVAAPASYSATAGVGLTDPANTGGPVGNARYASSIANFASSHDVLDEAAKKLDMSYTDLRAAVTAAAAADSSFVSITATADSPQKATDRANEVMNALLDGLGKQWNSRYDAQEQALDTRATALEKLAGPGTTDAEKSIAQDGMKEVNIQRIDLEQDRARFNDGKQFATPALVPAKAGVKNIVLYGGLGAVLAAVLAVVLSWILADRQRRVERPEVTGAITGAPLLGEVPQLRGAPARAIARFEEMPAAPFAFVAAGLGTTFEHGVVMVSGADHDAGATTTAANIAAAFARDGRRVVIVDTDGADRSLSRLAQISDTNPGLSDVLTRRAPLEDSLRAVELGESESVAVLPAGRHEPDLASLLRTKAMGDMVERLREWYDVVVIDTPPLTAHPEAASVAPYVDGLVIVVARHTPLRNLVRMRERIDLIGKHVYGYVFNRDPEAEMSVSKARSGLAQ